MSKSATRKHKRYRSPVSQRLRPIITTRSFQSAVCAFAFLHPGRRHLEASARVRKDFFRDWSKKLSLCLLDGQFSGDPNDRDLREIVLFCPQSREMPHFQGFRRTIDGPTWRLEG
jgi:hypothetical protein